jgi:hypothetical protein
MMSRGLNRLLDKLSEFLAPRKGLLPLLGLFLIGLDFILQLILPLWLGDLHILLYAGLFIAIIGLMLAQAL